MKHCLSIVKCTVSTVLASFALSAPTAAQSPLVTGSPTPLPGDMQIATAGGVQHFPAVAAGSASYLAVWEDHRAAVSGLFTKEGSLDLFGRRVAPDGTAIDALPFRLTDVPGRKEQVSIAFRDGVWLVAWEQSVPTTFSKSVQVSALRIAEDGTILDPAPIAVRTYQWSSTLTYALTADAAGWAIAVQGSSGGESNLEGWRVTPTGAVVAGSAGSLLPGASLWTHLALGSNGSGLLVAGSSGGVLQTQRLDPSFGFVGSSAVHASGGAERPRLASDGEDYLLAWENQQAWIVYSRRITSGGVAGPVQQLSASSEDSWDPTVVWNGSEYLVAHAANTFVWPAGNTFDIRVARVAANGTPTLAPGVALGQGVEPSDPRVAALAGGGAQVVWRDATTPQHVGDVFASAVFAAGYGAATALSTSASRQYHADVAAGGPGFLAVFTSERDGSLAVLCQRLDPAGQPIDVEPIEVASSPDFHEPRVAWNGTSFLVVWEHAVGPTTQDRVLGRRVAADGSFLDAAPFVVMDGGTPDVEALGNTFLVVARRAVTTQIFRIFAVRVDGAGQVVGPEATVGSNFARWPRVAALADRWAVAWQRNPTHDNPSASAFARVVLPDMTLGSEMFVDGGSHPTVAASSDRALVAFSAGSGVTVRLLDPNGVPLAPSFVAGDTSGAQAMAGAAWANGAFVVAWQDARGAISFVDERRDVYAGRITASGALLDGPSGVAVFAAADDESQPAVAATTAGALLFAATSFHPGAPYATLRIETATGSSWSPAGGGGSLILVGGGTLASQGGGIGLTVLGAAPGATGAHVLGISAWHLPLFGTLLVPAPDAVVHFAANAGGQASLAIPLGAVPPGFELWAQSFTFGAGTPGGLAASGALYQRAP